MMVRKYLQVREQLFPEVRNNLHIAQPKFSSG